MACGEKVTCDVCGIQKGEANHWIMWLETQEGPGPGEVTFKPWTEHYQKWNHVCGESCAGKLLTKVVASWSCCGI